MVISGRDAGWTLAGVAAPGEGVDPDGAGAADAAGGANNAGDEAASAGTGVTAAPLAPVALPSNDLGGPVAEALLVATAFPVLGFGAGVVAGGFVALAAAGGCAAVPGELVAFGAEEFPCVGAGVGALGAAAAPWDAPAGGPLCAGGGVVWLGFFSSEGR